MITVTYLNREGGGFSEHYEVPEGQTISEFLTARNVDSENMTIRIMRNGNPFTPSSTDTLQQGDRVSCVPLKVEGA